MKQNHKQKTRTAVLLLLDIYRNILKTATYPSDRSPYVISGPKGKGRLWGRTTGQAVNRRPFIV